MDRVTYGSGHVRRTEKDRKLGDSSVERGEKTRGTSNSWTALHSKGLEANKRTPRGVLVQAKKNDSGMLIPTWWRPQGPRRSLPVELVRLFVTLLSV